MGVFFSKSLRMFRNVHDWDIKYLVPLIPSTLNHDPYDEDTPGHIISEGGVKQKMSQ